MIDLRVPACAGYSSLVAIVVQDAAARAELSERQREDLGQAARSAFKLVVQEAMAGERDPMHVRVSWTAAVLHVSLTERGLPLDDAAAQRSPHWHDILARIDRAHWVLHPRGSELQLTVLRPHGFARETPVQAPADALALAPLQEYTIRRFRPEDAPGVARAFFQTWGYHYIFPAVYVPHRLIELNAKNAYISIVAVAQNGDIVGHYALDPLPGTPIADGCAAVVVPAHRGRGLLERMRTEMEAEAVRLGLAAYYTEPVTTHTRTQTESAKFGAQLCAIVLGGDPAAFVPKAMEYTGAGQRQSYTVYFKPLQTRATRTIYSPAKHRDMIERIYANLGLPIDVRSGTPAAADGKLRVEVNRTEGFATLDVISPGANSAQQIAQAVRDLRDLRHIGAMYANLPLDDPGTPQLCEALELLGFFFSGAVPWMMEGVDVLRLQLPLTPIDLSQVTIAGSFGEELKAYISAERDALQ